MTPGVRLYLVLPVLLAVFAVAWPASAQTIALDGVAPADAIGAASAHLADPNADLDVGAALHLYKEGAFKPFETRHFEAGYSTTPHWVVTRIRNDARDETAFRVLTNLPFVPAISIFLVREGGEVETLIEKRLDTPWRADQFLSLAVATLTFTLAPGEGALLATRFHPYGVGTLPMTIDTELSAVRRGGDAAFVRAAFYGFALTSILMLSLYVFAIWRTDGVRLIVTTLSGLLIMAQIDGVLNAYLWPNAPGWNKVASFPLLMLLCASMFHLAGGAFRSAQRPKLARAASVMALLGLAIVPLMSVVEAAALILAGFAMLILGLSTLSYASISIMRLLPSRFAIALAVAVFVFIGVSVLLAGVVTGRGDVGAQNLLTSKIMYAMMTIIFIASYAAQAAGLARLEARYARRELAQAKAAASASAALLDAERKFIRARDAELRQTQRLENISHDLRQPISALKSTLAPLMEGDKGKGMQSAIDYLDRLVGARLANDPDYIDQEDQTDVEESIPALLVVNAAAEMFRRRAEEKNLKLRARACDGAVKAPPIQLMRIVNNLVSNAVEHTMTGGVLVSARRRGVHILIEVRDTGPGMTEDEISAFAGRYAKSDASGGEGLGLAICFELARQNGIPLTVKSKLSRGTSFCLSVQAAT